MNERERVFLRRSKDIEDTREEGEEERERKKISLKILEKLETELATVNRPFSGNSENLLLASHPQNQV